MRNSGSFTYLTIVFIDLLSIEHSAFGVYWMDGCLGMNFMSLVLKLSTLLLFCIWCVFGRVVYSFAWLAFLCVYSILDSNHVFYLDAVFIDLGSCVYLSLGRR